MLFAKIVYRLITNFAPALLQLGAIFNPKIKAFLEGQKSISYKLAVIKQFRIQNPDAVIVWFHCASLGEFEQGRPIIEAYKKANDGHYILLTFFSPSGYEIQKNYKFADFVSYLPIDKKSIVNEFVETVNAKICVLVKYEFWVNLIDAIYANGTKIVGVSVILREDQVMFKSYGKFIMDSLKKIRLVFLCKINPRPNCLKIRVLKI